MDKKNRAAFGGFLHGNQKADFAGENPAEYLAPEVSVCDFALENGFANSVYSSKSGTIGVNRYNESWDVEKEGDRNLVEGMEYYTEGSINF